MPFSQSLYIVSQSFCFAYFKLILDTILNTILAVPCLVTTIKQWQVEILMLCIKFVSKLIRAV